MRTWTIVGFAIALMFGWLAAMGHANERKGATLCLSAPAAATVESNTGIITFAHLAIPSDSRHQGGAARAGDCVVVLAAQTATYERFRPLKGPNLGGFEAACNSGTLFAHTPSRLSTA